VPSGRATSGDKPRREVGITLDLYFEGARAFGECNCRQKTFRGEGDGILFIQIADRPRSSLSPPSRGEAARRVCFDARVPRERLERRAAGEL